MRPTLDEDDVAGRGPASRCGLPRASRNGSGFPNLGEYHDAARHVLVLSRNIDAVACITLGLQNRFAVGHFTSSEQVPITELMPRCCAAFVDCVMPTSIFQAIRAADQSSRVRVIGIRDERAPHRPLELLAQHLIAAYIKVPVTLSVVDRLIGNPPDDRRRHACSPQGRRGAGKR